MSAEFIKESNYYPFGLKHQGYNALAGNPAYQYQYNGKELQKESGMYMIMERDFICRIWEDGVWEIRWRRNTEGILLTIML